jgi:hypothetical protein
MRDQRQIDDDRTRLNDIAEQWSADGSLPEDISMEDVEGTCNALYDELQEVVETHATKTSLTRREAEVWAFAHSKGQTYSVLTMDAIAIAMSAPDSPFGNGGPACDDVDPENPPTESALREHYARAEEKYREAEEFVGATTFWDREDRLAVPSITWLGAPTLQRIWDRAEPEETTVDAVLNRLLDETANCYSLSEFLQKYLESQGREHVQQITLERSTLQGSWLSMVSLTSVDDEMGIRNNWEYKLPEVVRETEYIVFEGVRYRFSFSEHPKGTFDLESRITLFARDDLSDHSSLAKRRTT